MTTCLTTFRTGLPGDSSTRWTSYQFFRTKKHVLDAISRKKLHPFAWGGRGRKFKSCHSDQNRRFNRTSDFLYFTGFFGILGACTASKTSAIFLLKIASKIGTTICLTTFVTKKLSAIRLFGTLRFLFYAKSRRFSALENRRFKLFDCCATNSNCCYEIVRFFVCYPHFPIIINVNNIIVKLFKFP